MYTRTISPPAPKPKSANELLAEVLADPEADAPRMVYADWLTQAGDPRGEFIALQLERDRLGEGAPAQLAERKAELLKKHKKAWVGEFAGTRIEYGFEGGVLRAGWNAFGDKCALALAASPILRSLTKLQLRSSKITAKGKSVLEASVRKAVELEL